MTKEVIEMGIGRSDCWAQFVGDLRERCLQYWYRIRKNRGQSSRIYKTVNSEHELENLNVAYEPHLVPPLYLRRREGIEVLEEWFRWAEEWSMILRVYGHITRTSSVMEIGCGLGRVAYPLRMILSSEGSYYGFDICQYKISFLQETYKKAYPNFHFIWANVHNTEYNPSGEVQAASFKFPYNDELFDIVYAASVFTHMLPDAVRNYFSESARVLKPGGRFVVSFFLLDLYRPGELRPPGFEDSAFDFDYSYGDYGDDFAIVNPENPDNMTAYRLRLIHRFADAVGLTMAQDPIPGYWSGSAESWVGAQELVVLQKQ